MQHVHVIKLMYAMLALMRERGVGDIQDATKGDDGDYGYDVHYKSSRSSILFKIFLFSSIIAQVTHTMSAAAI